MKKFIAYLKDQWYAVLLETFVLILGILLALYFDGLKKENQDEQDLKEALGIVKIDIEKDIEAIMATQEDMDTLGGQLDKFLTGEITETQLEKCMQCIRYPLLDFTFSPQERGFNTLSKLPLYKPLPTDDADYDEVMENNHEIENLNLIIDTYYYLVNHHIKDIQTYLKEDVKSNLEYFKQNVPQYWYLDTEQGLNEFDAYSSYYLNMIALNRQLSANYYDAITGMRDLGLVILDGIPKVIDD